MTFECKQCRKVIKYMRLTLVQIGLQGKVIRCQDPYNHVILFNDLGIKIASAVYKHTFLWQNNPCKLIVSLADQQVRKLLGFFTLISLCKAEVRKLLGFHTYFSLQSRGQEVAWFFTLISLCKAEVRKLFGFSHLFLSAKQR